MPVQSDLEFRNRGTHFRIFPQPPLLPAFREPEVVWLSPSLGAIRPDPTDVHPGPDSHFQRIDYNNPDRNRFFIVSTTQCLTNYRYEGTRFD